MKLLHVVPIAKGITKQELSYFTTKPTKAGEIVFVPLRKKVVPALVLESVSIENVKGKIKASTFAMKKVDAKAGKMFLLPAFINAAEATSVYFASSMGAVLHQSVPKSLFEIFEKLPSLKAPKRKTESSVVIEKLILEADEETRIGHFKNIVREEFARENSVFITVSSVREAERIENELLKGIESYVFVLHSEVSKKELERRILTVLDTKHPVLIIGTPTFLSVPRNDVGTIIVERESSRGFKRQTRPFIDMRVFAEKYAEALGVRIVFADIPLSIEAHYKNKRGEYDELKSLRTRIVGEADQYIVDMRNKDGESNSFSPISNLLLEHIENAADNGTQTYLFNVRRGIAPSTVCEDCGSLVTCNKCHSPVVLHKHRNQNVFLCHSCGDVRSAKERCANCDSWKLKALGIGTERVREELLKHFPEKKIFTIDSDSTKTYKQAKRVAQDFYKTRGGILIGTELSLSFLDKKVANTAVVSLDSLLSIPDAKIHEHVFSLVIKIREMTRNAFFLQTRQPELPVIKYATEGNIGGFYEKEILQRRRFDYPPFTILIKITCTGDPKKASTEMENVERHLKDFDFSIYPGFTPLKGGVYALHGLLKIPESKWPDKKLVSLLRSLPPNVSVNVTPQSTL